MHAIPCLHSPAPLSASTSTLLESELKNGGTGLSFLKHFIQLQKYSEQNLETSSYFEAKKKKVSLGLMWEVVFYLYSHM